MKRTPGVLVKSTAAIAVVAASVIVAVGTAGAEPGFSGAQQMPVPSGMSSNTVQYDSVSCATATNCTAAGTTATGDPFVVTEVSGSWGTPKVIDLPAGGVSAEFGVSCPSVGNCLAAGGYATSSKATRLLLVKESGGTWGAATTATPPADSLSGSLEHAVFAAPWCSSAGNCEVVGDYTVAGPAWRLMTVTETSGTFSAARALPGVEAGAPNSTSLGCSSIGNCAAASQDAGWTETGGTWSSPAVLDSSQSDNLAVAGVGCPSATTCIVVGTTQVYACSCRPAINATSITETSGTFAAPEFIPAPKLAPYVLISGLGGISCRLDLCVTVGSGGSYNDLDPYEQPIAATWSAGAWSSEGIEPLNPAGANETNASWFNDVACASGSKCIAVGLAGVYKNESGPNWLYPYSTSISPVRPVVAPGQPSAFSVTAELGGAQVNWSSPTDDGGAPIASFTAAAAPGAASCSTASYSCELTGLTNGHRYTVTITDTNGSSSSRPLVSQHFVPGAVPTPPTKLAVHRMSHSAVVSWTRSTAPVDEPVRYVANAHGKRTELHHCVTATRSCTFRRLVKGRTYVVVISAIDASGRSSPAIIRFTAR